MDHIHLLKIAWRSCWRNWRYSVATFVTLAVGMASLLIFGCYIHGVDEILKEQFQTRFMFGDVIIETKLQGENSGGWETMITGEQQAHLRKILQKRSAGIREQLRFLRIDGETFLGDRSASFLGLAYERDSGERLRGSKWAWNAVAGQPMAHDRDIVLGQLMARRLDCASGAATYLNSSGGGPRYVPKKRPLLCGGREAESKPTMIQVVTESGQVNAANFSLRGIVDGGFRDADRMWAMFDLKSAQTLLDTNKISWVSLQLKKGLSGTAAAAALIPDLDPIGLTAIPWDRHPMTELYGRAIELLGVYDNFISIILYSIIALSIFSLMIKIIDERTREIGLLLSLGFPPHVIRVLFIYEASISSLVGLVGGSIAAIPIALAVNGLGVHYRGGFMSEPVLLLIDLDAHFWITILAKLFFLAVVSTYAAVLRTLRKSAIECLVH